MVRTHAESAYVDSNPCGPANGRNAPLWSACCGVSGRFGGRLNESPARGGPANGRNTPIRAGRRGVLGPFGAGDRGRRLGAGCPRAHDQRDTGGDAGGAARGGSLAEC